MEAANRKGELTVWNKEGASEPPHPPHPPHPPPPLPLHPHLHYWIFNAAFPLALIDQVIELPITPHPALSLPPLSSAPLIEITTTLFLVIGPSAVTEICECVSMLYNILDMSAQVMALKEYVASLIKFEGSCYLKAWKYWHALITNSSWSINLTFRNVYVLWFMPGRIKIKHKQFQRKHYTQTVRRHIESYKN